MVIEGQQLTINFLNTLFWDFCRWQRDARMMMPRRFLLCGVLERACHVTSLQSHSFRCPIACCLPLTDLSKSVFRCTDQGQRLNTISVSSLSLVCSPFSGWKTVFLPTLVFFQVEKQGKLNELDVVVPLRLNQVEHVYNAAVPSDLSQCLVFANNALTGLQRRIKELQLEKSEQRKFYKFVLVSIYTFFLGGVNTSFTRPPPFPILVQAAFYEKQKGHTWATVALFCHNSVVFIS